jgi:hypothetical protein
VSRFEYLSVLISIVIALGISEMVSSWGRLLRHRARVRQYWVHGLWSLLIALMMVQFWWGFWQYRVIADWSFVGLVAVLAVTLVMVLAALVLTPSDPIVESLDLRIHYYENTRVFFVLGLALIAQLAVVDALVGKQPFLHVENLFRAVALGVVGWAAVSQSERVHAALALAGLGLLLAFTAFAFTS